MTAGYSSLSSSAESSSSSSNSSSKSSSSDIQLYRKYVRYKHYVTNYLILAMIMQLHVPMEQRRASLPSRRASTYVWSSIGWRHLAHKGSLYGNAGDGQKLRIKIAPVSFLYSQTVDSAVMGRVEKGVACSVTGCQNPAERSMSRNKAAMAPDMDLGGAKRVYLCHAHYKEWKKATKEDRENER